MSEKQMGNNIDEIFRKGIDPLNTEPSDEFWRKAAEDVIARGDKSTERKAAWWRTLAFILGAGLLGLGFFAYKMQTGLQNAKQQTLAVKNIQNQNVEKTNLPVTVNTTASAVNNSTTATPNNTGASKKQIITNPSKRTAVAHTSQHTFITKPTTVLAVNRNYTPGKKHQNTIVAAMAKATDKTTTEKQDNPISENNKTGNTTTTEAVLTPVQKPVLKNTENTPSAPAEYVQKTNKPIAVAMVDTAKATQIKSLAAIPDSSRFSIAAFFAPDFAIGYNFKTTNEEGSEYESDIKTGEKQSFSYTAGLKAEYKISSRFSIGTGLGYQEFSFHVSPTIIYAQKPSGSEVGYYLTTSSGVLDCPYYGPVNIGDSLKMNATSTRTYLEIPVQLKYFVINKAKCKIYIIGGLEANISLGENTTMNWQDFWNESGVANVTATQGAKNIYYSYYAGAGIDYTLGKSFSIYAEPGLHEAITSLDDNVSVITYPGLFSITTGITFHF